MKYSILRKSVTPNRHKLVHDLLNVMVIFEYMEVRHVVRYQINNKAYKVKAFSNELQHHVISKYITDFIIAGKQPIVYYNTK